MAPLTTTQQNDLLYRGFLQDEVNWVSGLPDEWSQWQAIGVFENRTKMRQAGFSAEEIGKLEQVSEGFGSEQWWKKAQYLQQLRGVNWNQLAQQGYTLEQMQWIQNLPDQESAWRALQQFQQSFGGNAPPGGGGMPGGGGAPPFNLPPGAGAAGEDSSAKAFIQGVLDMYGLGGLANWAWEQYKNGAPIEQILLDIRKRPEYKARFPAMETLAQRGRAISETEYIEYERNAVQIMRSVGLPKGFYDQPADFAKLIGGEVSIRELSDRILTEFNKVANTLPEIRAAFKGYFGIDGDAALAAVYLDPDKALPVLQKMTQAASFGGFGKAAGFDPSKDYAMRAAELGITDDQARQGFSQLGDIAPLFRETIDERKDYTPNKEGIGAVFELEPGMRQTVERRRAEREAAFAGNPRGGAIIDTTGAIGLGSSGRGTRR